MLAVFSGNLVLVVLVVGFFLNLFFEIIVYSSLVMSFSSGMGLKYVYVYLSGWEGWLVRFSI